MTDHVLKVLRDTVAFNLKAIEREIADFEAIESPTSLDELRSRAMSTFYAGLYQQARPLINALVGLEHTERNIVKLAQVEQRLGNTNRAVTIARQALSSNPKCFPAYEVLANSLLEAGEYQEALYTANKALELEPQSARMKAVSSLSEFAVNNPETLGGTGDMAVDALLSSLFVGANPSDSDITDIVGRLSERELSPAMARYEMI